MKQRLTLEVRNDGKKITIAYRWGLRDWAILAIVLAVWAFMLIDVLPNITQR
jgi:hypothetical protein